jgi:hypothetical protein
MAATNKSLEKQWTDKATKAFKGKTVAEITYLTKEEVDDMGWYTAAPIVVFTDGSYLMASADPEGNGPGTFYTPLDGLSIIGPI